MRVDEILGKRGKRREVLESVNIVQFKNPVEIDLLEKIIHLMKTRMPLWKREIKVVFSIVDNTKFQYSIYPKDDSPMSNARLSDLSRAMSENLIKILDMLDIKDNFKYLMLDYESNELDDDGHMAMKA